MKRTVCLTVCLISFNAATDAYTALWSNRITGGIWNGNTWYWSMAGQVELVPEPASVHLIGSGMVCPLGLAGRKG